jgi:SAM-dependent methyltransferase
MRLQEHYGKYVSSGGDGPTVLQERAADLGYDTDWLPPKMNIPSLFQASCGSGCPLRILPSLPCSTGGGGGGGGGGGMPTADDSLILDFGCGAGHDALLACHFLMTSNSKNNNSNNSNNSNNNSSSSSSSSNNNNNNKRVIGVDLTPEMIAAAKDNAKQYPELTKHVEFVEANLEDSDSTEDFLSALENHVDLILSNGVFNLCRDKQKIFDVMHRLLKPGGRLVFSDVMKVKKQEEINANATIATSMSINGDVFSS